MFTYRKIPFVKRYSTEWMKYCKQPERWAKSDVLRDYVNTWVNNTWSKDTWGGGDIWQGLDSTLNSTIRFNSRSNTDIAYGEKPWQRLDVFTPTNSIRTSKPVLVFFYGGGWHDGSKEKYRYVANTFTNLGYVVVIPDYVKFPSGKFPDFIHDGAKALSWVKDNIHDHGGDVQNLFLAGHSAGAHLGALLSTDQRYLDNVGINKKEINAFVGLAGPYDFTPWVKRYCDVFDDPALYPDIQVSNFVDGTEAPMMLAQASADMIVGSHTNAPLIRALEQAGVSVECPKYKGMGHMGIVLALSSIYGQDNTVIGDMHRFFQRYIRPS